MNRQFLAFVKAYSIESVRNSVSLFFTVFFPVVFLLIFGFLFSEESSYRRTIGICADDERIVSALQDAGSWDLIIYKDEQNLQKQIEDGKLSMGIVVSGKKAILYYQNSPSLMGEVKMIELSAKSVIEKAMNNLVSFIQIDTVEVKEAKREISDFDYMMMGVIALSLFSNGMFSMISVFGNYRKKGILRRVSLTCTKPIIVVISVSLIRMLLSFLSLVVVLLLCRAVFNSEIEFNWFLLIPTVVSVTLGMMALGVMIVSLFRNPNAASNVGSVLNTVMVFFSGVYFPITFMPSYIRWVAYILPVKYAADLVRYSADAQNMNAWFFLIVNTIFLVCGIVALWFSAKELVESE
ncbi:MAG: ABC transporter permease [Pseudothermotoga sp.]